MSRRNKYYDDDDLEDYSDGDYSDEGEYDNRKGGSSPKRVEVDDEEEPEDFVQYIRDRLDKTPLINNETIITQLEKHNYNVKSALTAVKNLQKQQQLKSKPIPNSTKPPPKAAPKVVETKTVSSSAKKPSSTQHTTIPTNTPSSTVFTKAQENLSMPTVPDTTDEDLSASLQQICMSDDDLSVDFTAPSPLPEVTLIVAGHVDSGKSTLVGHLLHKLGKVTSRTIAQHQRDSSAMGKGSFSLAWVMDERKSERAHGVTIDIAEKQFTLNNRSFTIMDAPGHRDFVPNMIKGASFANFALLIIPATEGEYETCMKDSAQTKEHATILKALGVTHIVIAINKMDATTNGPWDQHRYEGIESEVRSFLVDSLQFANENVFALPISAITGENIQEMSSSCLAKSWYSGPTLKEILEQLPSPNAEIHKPFRGIVHNIKFTSRNELDLTVSLLQGKISLNRSIALIDYQATHCKLQVGFVKQISDMEGNELPIACGHHRVVLHIAPPKNSKGFELNEYDDLRVAKGPPCPQLTTSFKAEITTLSTLHVPLLPKVKYECYFQGIEMQCEITKIMEVTNLQSTPAVTTTNPMKLRMIPRDYRAIVQVIPQFPLVIDHQGICEQWSRFALRSKGQTIAVGQCIE